jgi:hypothetical protein
VASIDFLVEYEDGATALMTLVHDALRGNDKVAITIAGQRQRLGLLPPGKIKSVRRDDMKSGPASP